MQSTKSGDWAKNVRVIEIHPNWTGGIEKTACDRIRAKRVYLKDVFW